MQLFSLLVMFCFSVWGLFYFSSISATMAMLLCLGAFVLSGMALIYESMALMSAWKHRQYNRKYRFMRKVIGEQDEI